MNKNEGLCPRRDKKNKLNSKTKFKKKRGEPKVKPDISPSTLFFYAAHDRRDRSLGPHLVSQKKELNAK
jgi:hypothetical protein